WLTPGAVFASVVALLATFLFGLYVSHFAGYNATYGALGAVVSFLMWLYVTAFVVLLGAELNAEIERQTAKDTTTGPDAPLGERGATMADTTAAGGDKPDHGEPDVTSADDRSSSPSKPSCAAPLVAGLAASRISRHVGDIPLGVVPMTLIAIGLTLIGQRGSATRGLLCLAGGGLLTWRTHVRAR
ncbi:MAG: YihY/virulence factor BrkB family protein, partial [Alphaproteobacteria bacterium]